MEKPIILVTIMVFIYGFHYLIVSMSQADQSLLKETPTLRIFIIKNC